MRDDERHRTLDENTIAVHEMYLSYVKAGFTAEQAMQLLLAHLAMATPPNKRNES